MKVKVGNTVYDGNEQPVMVILTDKDKENITNMHPNAIKYACFPEEYSTKEIEKWMLDEREEIKKM